MEVIIGPLIQLIDLLARIMMFLIVGRVILSWVSPDPFNPIVRFIHQCTEPILAPIRRFLPNMPLDISPILAWFLIEVARNVLIRILLMPLM